MPRGYDGPAGRSPEKKLVSTRLEEDPGRQAESDGGNFGAHTGLSESGDVHGEEEAERPPDDVSTSTRKRWRKRRDPGGRATVCTARLVSRYFF